MQPSITREIVDRRQPTIRWGAVFAGAAVSVGLWVLLQMIGMGIGLAAIDTDDSGSLRSVGIGTTVWSLIVPLLALFAGGMLAAKLSNTRDRTNGGLHGLVVWALSAVLGVATTIMLVSMVATGAARFGGTFDSAMVVGDRGDELGGEANDVLAPINQKLHQAGKPTITVAQLVATTRGVVASAARDGKIDHDQFVTQLANHTSLTRAEAEDLATQLGVRWQGVMDDLGRTEHEAAREALIAADATGKALLMGGLSLLLGLIAAMVGGMAAVRTGYERGRHNTLQNPVVPPPPPPVDVIP